MKKYLMILLITFLVFPVFVSAFSLSGDTSFYKMDENGNLITDAEFIFRDLNNKVNYEVSHSSDNPAYKYKGEKSDTYDKLVNFVPPNVLEIISGFHNSSDIMPYVSNDNTHFSNIKANCNLSATGFNDTNSNNMKKVMESHNYHNCVVTIPSVAFLEEIKTPMGFEKTIVVLPIYIKIKYILDPDTQDIVNTESVLYNYDFSHYYDENEQRHDLGEMYKYDETLDYNNIKNVFDTLTNNNETMLYGRTHECVDRSVSSMNSSFSSYIIKKLGTEYNLDCNKSIVIDKAGKSELSVESYVNSKEEVSIEETSTVKIKVFLKNEGKAPSYDNVVVSHVPEGVEYVEGSATDNGVYSDNNNTVTWNLEYLDSKSGYTFAYDVVVPTGTKASIYITKSSVSASDTEEPIASNEAKVTTSGSGTTVSNPKTGDTRSQILITLLIMSVAILTYSLTHRSIKL